MNKAAAGARLGPCRKRVMVPLMVIVATWLGESLMTSDKQRSPTRSAPSARQGSAQAPPERYARAVEATPRGIEVQGGETAPGGAVLPWENAVLCRSQSLRDWLTYLHGFRSFGTTGSTVYADPAVQTNIAVGLSAELEAARQEVRRRIGIDAESPLLYVHRDIATLRAHSCVPPNAVAFYDGAIHVADISQEEGGSRELWRSLLHEYTHHALLTHGIQHPAWFQEGLAMHVGQESVRDFKVSWPGIHPTQMNEVPRAASTSSLGQFYGQSFMMVAFLETLCAGRVGCGEARFVSKLRDGAEPTTFFESSVRELNLSSNVDPLERWQGYFKTFTRQ